MYVCVHAHPMSGTYQIPAVRVTGGCKPPDMGTENQTQVLRKNSKSFFVCFYEIEFKASLIYRSKFQEIKTVMKIIHISYNRRNYFRDSIFENITFFMCMHQGAAANGKL